MNAPVLVNGLFADDFFPFSLTRSVADIRCGILTIREKWQYYIVKHPRLAELSIPANIIPDDELVQALLSGNAVAAFSNAKQLGTLGDILKFNAAEIKHDFNLVTVGRASQKVSDTNRIIKTPVHPDLIATPVNLNQISSNQTSGDQQRVHHIFIEPGAIVEHCILNISEGPVYIGKDCLVMEGSMIRGPFAIGEGGVVKMGSRIYGATSAGPHCVLGGEIKNTILFGYSNKAHDGYLGDSVIGEWCNFGAGSSNSNLKNSGGSVKYWNPLKKSFLDAGIKGGLLMGDYCRSAINTSFTTGSVVGACAHVFGNGLSPAYLPSFSWGFQNEVYEFEKAVQHIQQWKSFKGQELSSTEIDQLRSVYKKRLTPGA